MSQRVMHSVVTVGLQHVTISCIQTYVGCWYYQCYITYRHECLNGSPQGCRHSGTHMSDRDLSSVSYTPTMYLSIIAGINDIINSFRRTSRVGYSELAWPSHLVV